MVEADAFSSSDDVAADVHVFSRASIIALECMVEFILSCQDGNFAHLVVEELHIQPLLDLS
jgi:hypothetical protein